MRLRRKALRRAAVPRPTTPKMLRDGDNRSNSRDSRWFGAVHRSAILGRATAVALSVDPERHYMPRWERFFSRHIKGPRIIIEDTMHHGCHHVIFVNELHHRASLVDAGGAARRVVQHLDAHRQITRADVGGVIARRAPAAIEGIGEHADRDTVAVDEVGRS